jgi:Histidine phosphatase superfamily (branch 1)
VNGAGDDDRVSATSYRLVLLRHGESEWNERGLFTAWTDVDLSARGELEAAQAGELLRRHDVLPDIVHHVGAAAPRSGPRTLRCSARSATGSRSAARGG